MRLRWEVRRQSHVAAVRINSAGADNSTVTKIEARKS